ncbi:unnamed protein product [Parnassius mnemosyne]|uniref:DUF4794 domain-containing protein n=1 Tax=Parnassius mnemosyne TaxID=213953 RepID=A0AAV1KRS1_9NEOP
MKLLVLFCLFVGALGEPPRRRPAGNLRQLPGFKPANFRFQRFEIAPTTTDSPAESTTNSGGPYPPSGWKSSGEPFTLPNEKAPVDTYGAPLVSGPYPPSGWKPAGQPFLLPQEQSPPASSYGVPENVYGAPDSSYGVPTTDAPVTDTTEKLEVEKLEGPVEVQKSVGTYYVLLPNGQLQKVEFLTENDIQNMKYTAKLQLRDRAPLYVYGR